MAFTPDLNTIHNPAAGTAPPAAWGDAIRDNFMSPPQTRVYNSANLSIPNAVATALTFNSERFDTDTLHSTSSNTSRITFQNSGTYYFGATVRFDSNATGYREVSILLNGATTIAVDSRPAVNGAGTVVNISGIYSFSLTNYIEVFAYQNSGVALNVTANGNYSPEFYAVWLNG